MKIHHVALYTKNLEGMKEFYMRYFGGRPNDKYVNPVKGFSSYFLRFEGDTSLEIMTKNQGLSDAEKGSDAMGYAHMAFDVSDRSAVDALTRQLREDGYPVISGPRVTGDGYYESCILDPDGNQVEITCAGSAG